MVFGRFLSGGIIVRLMKAEAGSSVEVYPVSTLYPPDLLGQCMYSVMPKQDFKLEVVQIDVGYYGYTIGGIFKATVRRRSL